jgi:hypothetical protein
VIDLPPADDVEPAPDEAIEPPVLEALPPTSRAAPVPFNQPGGFVMPQHPEPVQNASHGPQKLAPRTDGGWNPLNRVTRNALGPRPDLMPAQKAPKVITTAYSNGAPNAFTTTGDQASSSGLNSSLEYALERDATGSDYSTTLSVVGQVHGVEQPDDGTISDDSPTASTSPIDRGGAPAMWQFVR